MNIASPLHILSVVIWVGGMFFAHMALRPVVAAQLQPSVRLPFMQAVLARFFPWVWICIVAILFSGLWMIFSVYGGFAGLAVHVHIMVGLGLVMMSVFVYIYFVPYKRLSKLVRTEAWPGAGANLAQVRRLIGLNLVLGLITVLISTGGMYWLQ
jgi:uncharacterized membrane protein